LNNKSPHDSASEKNTITAIIADDEPLMRFHLKKQLEDLWPEIEIVAQAKNGSEALQHITDFSPDVVFLDIQMPAMSGLEVAQRLRQEKIFSGPIVFVTAFDQYAVDAFEREAIDYLLKPFNDDRLLKTIDRLRQRLSLTDASHSPSSKASAPSPEELTDSLQRLIQQINSASNSDQNPNPNQSESSAFLKWIKVSHKDEVIILPVGDVRYFQAGDKYTSVMTRNTEYLIRKPIKELVNELNPDDFWRIHRGYVIAVNRIESCQRDFSGRLQVSLKGEPEQRLPVSRSYAHLFKQM